MASRQAFEWESWKGQPLGSPGPLPWTGRFHSLVWLCPMPLAPGTVQASLLGNAIPAACGSPAALLGSDQRSAYRHAMKHIPCALVLCGPFPRAVRKPCISPTNARWMRKPRSSLVLCSIVDHVDPCTVPGGLFLMTNARWMRKPRRSLVVCPFPSMSHFH